MLIRAQRYTFFSRCARKIAFWCDFSLKTDKSTISGKESIFLGWETTFLGTELTFLGYQS
jgi:hypothetical protein